MLEMILDFFRGIYHEWKKSDFERYMEDSTDVFDIEHRQQEWDRKRAKDHFMSGF